MASVATAVRQAARSVGLIPPTPDQFEAKVAQAQAAVVAAESAFRVAANLAVAEPSPEHDETLAAARAARTRAQEHLEACEIALAASKTEEGRRAAAVERKRIEAEDRAAAAIITDHEAAIVHLADTVARYTEAFAAAREAEHQLVDLFVANGRIRQREDLITSFDLATNVAVELARTVPDVRSSEISNALASAPPGSIVSGGMFETTTPRSQWKTLSQKAAERAETMLALLTVRPK